MGGRCYHQRPPVHYSFRRLRTWWWPSRSPVKLSLLGSFSQSSDKTLDKLLLFSAVLVPNPQILANSSNLNITIPLSLVLSSLFHFQFRCDTSTKYTASKEVERGALYLIRKHYQSLGITLRSGVPDPFAGNEIQVCLPVA